LIEKNGDDFMKFAHRDQVRFISRDDRDISIPVAIINDTMAAEYWPNQNPLGRRLELPEGKNFLQIIGIVKIPFLSPCATKFTAPIPRWRSKISVLDEAQVVRAFYSIEGARETAPQ